MPGDAGTAPGRDAFARVSGGLFQPERGLWFAPIRHHSPACAWAVRALIEEVRPRHVLVEAPVDLEPLIGLLLDGATRPPVAIAALVDATPGEGGAASGTDRRLACHYPFCAHSPELVALRTGRAVGAALRFVDAPSAALATRRARGREDRAAPVPLADDRPFDGNDYVEALRRRFGCRDGFELWDHLFESRLGTADWRALLADIGAYCAGLREAEDPTRIEAGGDAAREAHMAAAVRAALAAGGPDADGMGAGGPVVVVAGGFHVPALIERTASPGRAANASGTTSTGAGAAFPDEDLAPARAYLVRYGFEALDALGGYAAGLPQPGWYDALWDAANAAGGPPPWREVALGIVGAFAARARADGHPIALPAEVELLRVAESLARLRGRPGIMRHDLIDGVATALVKGEAGPGEPWTGRFVAHLRGDALGDVPRSAGSPPLVEDARAEARRHRIDVTDGARRRRRLDLRRKPAHLAASRFLHAMTLLETGFAERESGPDLVHGVGTDRLFEHWSHAWSPLVEGRLVELAALGDRVDGACLALLLRRREAMAGEGRGGDVARLVELLAVGLRAGLGERLAPFVDGLSTDVAGCTGFAPLARALERLDALARSSGPLAAPAALDLGRVRDAAYRRIAYLCDDLSRAREEDLADCLEALRIVVALLDPEGAGRGGAGGDDVAHGDAPDGAPVGARLDPAPFHDAIDRLAVSSAPAALVGAALAIAVGAGLRPPEALAGALAGRLSGAAPDPGERVGTLRGALHVAPALLWREPAVLEAVDRFLVGLDPDAFLALLPHLRLAFAALNPREVDRLATHLARAHGGGTFAPTSHGIDEADLALGLELEADLRRSIAADGLGGWLAGTRDGPDVPRP